MTPEERKIERHLKSEARIAKNRESARARYQVKIETQTLAKRKAEAEQALHDAEVRLKIIGLSKLPYPTELTSHLVIYFTTISVATNRLLRELKR